MISAVRATGVCSSRAANPWDIRVFVVTHRPEEEHDASEFSFVGDFDDAIERAREVAGDKHVAIGGGADVIRRGLDAGVIDELAIIVAPVILGGGGEALFDGFTKSLDLEHIGMGQLEWATLIEYRVRGRAAPAAPDGDRGKVTSAPALAGEPLGHASACAVTESTRPRLTHRRGARDRWSAKRAEEESGTPGEDILVGAAPGRLRQALDGGYIATALAGPCAITMLCGDTELLVRDEAS